MTSNLDIPYITFDFHPQAPTRTRIEKRVIAQLELSGFNPLGQKMAGLIRDYTYEIAGSLHHDTFDDFKLIGIETERQKRQRILHRRETGKQFYPKHKRPGEMLDHYAKILFSRLLSVEWTETEMLYFWSRSQGLHYGDHSPQGFLFWLAQIIDHYMLDIAAAAYRVDYTEHHRAIARLGAYWRAAKNEAFETEWEKRFLEYEPENEAAALIKAHPRVFKPDGVRYRRKSARNALQAEAPRPHEYQPEASQLRSAILDGLKNAGLDAELWDQANGRTNFFPLHGPGNPNVFMAHSQQAAQIDLMIAHMRYNTFTTMLALGQAKEALSFEGANKTLPEIIEYDPDDYSILVYLADNARITPKTLPSWSIASTRIGAYLFQNELKPHERLYQGHPIMALDRYRTSNGVTYSFDRHTGIETLEAPSVLSVIDLPGIETWDIEEMDGPFLLRKETDRLVRLTDPPAGFEPDPVIAWYQAVHAELRPE